MVTRKPSSLPYPTSPPPPPPPEFGPSVSSHDVDAANLPRIPSLKKRLTGDSPYHDMGNPWQEESATTGMQRTAQSTPVIVQPDAHTNPSGHVGGSQQVPDILKPGWSGENTPRSSLDSDRSKDFWESSDEEKDPLQDTKSKNDVKSKEETKKPSSTPEIPAILQVRRKPVSPRVTQDTEDTRFDKGFASNNPFRVQQQIDAGASSDEWMHVTDIKGKQKDHDPYGSFPAHASQRNLLEDDDRPSSTAHPDDALSAWEPVAKALPALPHDQRPVVPTSAPPPPPPVSVIPPSPFSEQPPLIPVEHELDDAVNPWKSSEALSRQQSPLPEQKAVYSNGLLDRGPQNGGNGGLVSLEDELKALPDHASSAPSRQSNTLIEPLMPQVHPQQTSTQAHPLSYAPPPGPPPSKSAPQASRQERPSLRPLTTAELAEMNDHRNETYQIKHFRWFDHRTRKLRSSSMLTQNKNGPCPLLALVNALILGAQDRDQAALDEFLRTREQVTLGTIIENLMMELLAAAEDGELPDVDELNRFLIKLRTGMNMNPRFVSAAAPAPYLMDARNSMLHIPETAAPLTRPGTFEPSQDLKLYSSFGVQTLHGWLPEPGSDAASAFERTAQNYEDAQAKLFGEDELEFKLTRNGLTPEEQVVWEDIVSMKHFLQSNPTQLTQYGLHCIRSSMPPGSFGVLFRNDHFSTIYLHPQEGRLYSLITDAGYADRDEIIWESLVDTSGHETEFFSGDFKSVSQNAGQTAGATSRRQSDQPAGHDSQDPNAPLSPSQRQEQEDADLAMAMQLQEEEEQRERERRTQGNSSNQQSQPQQPSRPGGRRSTGNIPIPIRGNTGTTNSPAQPPRPFVPARGSRSNVPAVNRPADANNPDAPPAYEEAARGEAYHPPLGSPLHPSSSTDGGNGFGSTSTVNLPETSNAGTRPGNNRGRRSSAYTENSDRYGRGSGQTSSDGPSPAYDFTDGRMPGSYIHTGRGGHGQSANMGQFQQGFVPNQRQSQRDRDRDCTVM